MTARRTASFGYPLAIVMVIALSGCATTTRDWDEAERNGTVAAYELFLQRHPNTAQANDARRLLPALRTDEDWTRAESLDTLDAYEGLLRKHPQSKHATQATARLDVLRFEHAAATDSVDAYESYLHHHPDGTAARDAHVRLRKLRFAATRQRTTVAAFESFIALYARGPDVDALKAELPDLRALDKALALGRAVMKFAPRTSISISDFAVTGMPTERSSPTGQDVSRLKTMLREGADPNAVRISGYEPASVKRLGRAGVLHSAGRPGQIVPAERGGITLLEYCRANDLDAYAALLIQHGAK